MTPQERAYLAGLADGYGFVWANVVELARAYGVPGQPAKWTGESKVERVADIIKANGPGFQLVAARKARRS